MYQSSRLPRSLLPTYTSARWNEERRDGGAEVSAYLASLLADLSGGQWVCASLWYSTMRPTFAQRFSEANAEARAAEGEDRIESRVCKRHEHRSTIHEYRDRWALRPQQLRIVG